MYSYVNIKQQQKQKKNEDTQKRYNKNKFVGSLIFIID